MAIQRLTAAYRSRSRPSSTLGAKASTMCPYYLDGDLGKSLAAPPGDTRVIGYCAVFKVREEAQARAPMPGTVVRRAPASGPVSQNSTACEPPRDGVTRPCGLPGPVDMLGRSLEAIAAHNGLPRKEVIQPQLPLRLPCYDFTPVASPTFDGSLQKVRPPASGVACFRGVTGGVYKARERIHRGNADPRLLATPPSCRRISACNPNRDAL